MSNCFKISIIIPFFNRINLLKETIDSVQHQESSDWELILIDDGSNEEVEGLISKYSSNKIRFYNRNRGPKGAPTCRNIGAEKASFDYLMFLDSDDLLAPWAIKKRIKTIQETPDKPLYVFEGLEFDNLTGDHRLRTIHKTTKPLELFLDFQSVWQTSCVVWQKKVFFEIGGWCEKVKSWQDGEIHIRYLNKYTEIVWGSNYPDVFIRKHNDINRISNQKGVEKIDNLVDTYYSTLQFLSDTDLKIKFETNIENALFSFAEDDIDHDLYIKWIKERFPERKFKKLLIWYVKLYKFLPKNSLFLRGVYQLRKLGIPNKRKHFWSIRPQLNSEALNKLKDEVAKNALLAKVITI